MTESDDVKPAETPTPAPAPAPLPWTDAEARALGLSDEQIRAHRAADERRAKLRPLAEDYPGCNRVACDQCGGPLLIHHVTQSRPRGERQIAAGLVFRGACGAERTVEVQGALVFSHETKPHVRDVPEPADGDDDRDGE